MNRLFLVNAVLKRSFSLLPSPVVRFYRSRPQSTIDKTALPELDDTEKSRINEVMRMQRYFRNSINHKVYDEESNSVDEQENHQQEKSSSSTSSSSTTSDSSQKVNSKPNKQKDSLLYDTPIPRESFTAEEYESLQELRDVVADPKSIKTRNPQELFRSMNLSESDRQFIVSEVNRYSSEPVHPKKNVDPAPFERLERLLMEDETIYTTLEQWMKEVEKVVGNKVNNPSSLTEEEIKQLPAAPQKLQEVMQFMLSGKK